jgi:hypothetical protein
MNSHFIKTSLCLFLLVCLNFNTYSKRGYEVVQFIDNPGVRSDFKNQACAQVLIMCDENTRAIVQPLKRKSGCEYLCPVEKKGIRKFLSRVFKGGKKKSGAAVKKVGKGTGNVIKKVGKGTGNAAKKVIKGTGNLAKKLKNGAGSLLNRAKNGTGSLANKVRNRGDAKKIKGNSCELVASQVIYPSTATCGNTSACVATAYCRKYKGRSNVSLSLMCNTVNGSCPDFKTCAAAPTPTWLFGKGDRKAEIHPVSSDSINQ